MSNSLGTFSVSVHVLSALTRDDVGTNYLMVVTCFLKGGRVVQASLTVTKRLVCWCLVVHTTLILSCNREWCTLRTVRSVTTLRLFEFGIVTSRTTMCPRIFIHISSAKHCGTITQVKVIGLSKMFFLSYSVHNITTLFAHNRGKCQLTTASY